ncbi:MarR family transcriptional regulator [Halorussus halobius]|uniref:MarR family transcriptional regulator n=1 Tax=Halorussus halobius TaxID=1710537 RepID=UPI001092B24C|nr:helix-turn-helix domain-containing protein [Halorussus halobius]
MTSLKIDSDAVRDLPPSAKLVYLVLKEAGPLTQQDVIERTLLPDRTARGALDELVDAGVVEKRPYLGGDARQSVYTVRSRESRRE